jgi:hypothetical protein
MAEQDLRGKWKVKSQKITKTVSPLIGFVYEGTNKFSGSKVVGILLEVYRDNDEAVLKTKKGEFVSTDLLTLKPITDEQ